MQQHSLVLPSKRTDVLSREVLDSIWLWSQDIRFSICCGKKDGSAEKNFHITHSLRPLVQNILLRYQPNLRMFDLGYDSTHFIMDWNVTPVRAPLTCLRVTMHIISDLLAILATPPLSATLRQLHVKLCDNWLDDDFRISEMKITFHMSSMTTFTFVKSLYQQYPEEWTLISPAVMPVLQRAKLIVAIALSDLDRIEWSALFNEHRIVDVQYAFILNDDLSHSSIDQRISRGGRSDFRPVASATFNRSTWNEELPYLMPEKCYESIVRSLVSCNIFESDNMSMNASCCS